MKERKYKEDWVNETSFDDRGKEKRIPVYRGSWFALRGVDSRSVLLHALVPWILYIVLLALYFVIDFPGTRILYVFLPAALGLFPCLYWVRGVLSISRTTGRMTRLQKENGIGRVLRSAAGCSVFSCCALIGDVIYLISGTERTREWPGFLLLLAAALPALYTVNFFRGIEHSLSEEGGPEI